MGSSLNAPRDWMRRRRVWLGALLLALGLLGHLLSAKAIGGSWIAYRDHVEGFLLLTVVSGVIVGVLGWRFWRGRNDITLLAVGTLQFILGVIIYMNRYNIH